MIVEVLQEDESRVRWSYDGGKTWRYADIDELIKAYEKGEENVNADMDDELNWDIRSDEWKAGWRAGQSGEDIGMPKEVLDSKSDEWKAGLIYAIKHPWGSCYVPMVKE